MSIFKTYEQFNEELDMSSIFKSAHGAISKDDIEPLSEFIGKPNFPTQTQVDEACDYLNIDQKYLFYIKSDVIHPIIYWKGPIYFGFFSGNMGIDMLKMQRANEMIKQYTDMFDKFIHAKQYERLFSRVEKKILIPTFIDMYDEIPDNTKYDIFTNLYMRSEYGFQEFPIDIIKDCLKKRNLSSDWKERMEKLDRDIKYNDDHTITIYRGENTMSSKSDDAFSWTLSKKTAKFFAERFNKHAGKISSKNIKFEEIVDYLSDRGESEILLFPKKFGTL